MELVGVGAGQHQTSFHTLPHKIAKGFGPDVWLLERGTIRRDSRGFIFRDAIHPEIVKRCLEQFTSTDDLVVSPFTGSGTVLAVAKMMGRRCIGYEVNLDLKPLIFTSIETPSLLKVYDGFNND